MVVECANCGTENPDYGFYCGGCGKELPRVSGVSTSEPAEPHQVSIQTLWEPGSPPDALVAIAVNVRRIVILMMLGVFLTLGGILVSWWTSYFWSNGNMSPSDLKTVVGVWGAFSAIVIAFGLYYAVFRKRITRL